MRDDPYPALFYGRQVDEPSPSDMVTTMAHDNSQVTIAPSPNLCRACSLLLLMTLYLGCALFLIFAVTSYAAPLGNATIH